MASGVGAGSTFDYRQLKKKPCREREREREREKERECLGAGWLGGHAWAEAELA